MNVNMNILTLFLFIIPNVDGLFGYNCNDFYIENECLNYGYCAWCNLSIPENDDHFYNIHNSSYNCIDMYVCQENQLLDSGCKLSNNYTSCGFYTFLYYSCIILIYISSVLSILEFLRINIYNSIQNKKQTYTILCIILLLITIPTIILWSIELSGFLYYLASLICINIVLWCCIGSKHLYNYNRINNNTEYTYLINSSST